MKNILSITLLSILMMVNINANEIIAGDTYSTTGISMQNYTIKGNNEECTLAYDITNNILTSKTCISLTNSKGVHIFCTKKKKTCKTKTEILNFINPSETEKTSNSNTFGVLKRWVNAHNAQDMNKLKNIYSNEITYYGKKLSRTKAIKDKKTALAKYPQFRIRTSNVEYISITPTISKITFNKNVQLAFNKKEKMYPSYLLVDLSTNLILVEGDTVTDNNIKKKTTTFTTTKGTVFKAKFNKHGAVLKSKSFTLYLGKDCDLSSPQFGNGSWVWFDGGTDLYFENKTIRLIGDLKSHIETERICSKEIRVNEVIKVKSTSDKNLLDKWKFTKLSNTGMKYLDKSTYTPITIMEECTSGFIGYSEIPYMNPYALVGKCGLIPIEIFTVTGRNTAFGYIRPFGTHIDYGMPLIVTAIGKQANYLAEGTTYQSFFKIVGTKKVDLVSNKIQLGITVLQIVE